jgi:predicted nucleotide-binding protein
MGLIDSPGSQPSFGASFAGLTPKGHDLAERFRGEVAQAPPTRTQQNSSWSRKVFIVHGHDAAPKAEVARFLERIGFEAIILHEQASRNRTIIEKIEAHGDVGFAVVLLTPDDEGCKKGETPKPRARQNVVLELGYFVGRLGRDRVCVLRRGDVEIPSDFGGVVYEPFDDGGGWKSKLAGELEAAEYAIDWSKVHK